MLLQIADERGNRRVCVSYLPIVQMFFVALRKRGWRLVRIMRVVKVHPHETRPCRLLRKPRFAVLNYLHSAALQPAPTRLGSGMRWKVVVEIESSVQPRSHGPAVQDHRPDKRSGSVTLRL